jgi:hypothetical protein
MEQIFAEYDIEHWLTTRPTGIYTYKIDSYSGCIIYTLYFERGIDAMLLKFDFGSMVSLTTYNNDATFSNEQLCFKE